MNSINDDNLKIALSSDAVKMKGKRLIEGKRALKYPFGQLTVGYSFGIVAITAPEIRSLNNAIAYYNRKGPNKYVIVNHSKTTPGLYEIGMTSDGLEEDGDIGEMYPVHPSSPEALAEMNKARGKTGKTKYPFRKLNVGESFTIPAESLNKRSLTALCSRFGKSLDRKFAMIIHNDGRCEVGRIK